MEKLEGKESREVAKDKHFYEDGAGLRDDFDSLNELSSRQADYGATSSVPAIAWQATEDVPRKTMAWYGVVLACGLGITALVALLTRDIASTATVFFGVLMLIVYANRKPTKQNYELSNGLIKIGQKVRNLHMYKAYSFDAHDGQLSLILYPLKRFSPLIVLPLEEKTADEVAKTLANYLPLEQTRPDWIESLARKIRL